MKLGEIIFKELPQLEVLGQKEIGDKKEPHTYYLSPFRAYGFQVSKTDEGEFSYGESKFIGLKNVVENNSEQVAKGIFFALAMTALYEHNKMYYKVWKTTLEEEKTLYAFVNESYSWVYNLLIEEKKQVLQELNTEQTEEKPGFLKRIKNIRKPKEQYR